MLKLFKEKKGWVTALAQINSKKGDKKKEKKGTDHI